jgi:hypothetical protein
MGSLERRLSDLEASLREELKGSGPTETRRFILDYLSAVGHVRRALIDTPGLRYELGGLLDLSAWSVAAYVAALITLEHEDRFEARDILAAKNDLAEGDQDCNRLEKLVGAACGLAARSRGVA